QALDCLGGRPTGRVYKGRVYAAMKKFSGNVCCRKSTEKAVAFWRLTDVALCVILTAILTSQGQSQLGQETSCGSGSTQRIPLENSFKHRLHLLRKVRLMDAQSDECSLEQGALPTNCCFSRERVCASEHFIRDNAQCPYVGRRASRLPDELFRRHITGGTRNGTRSRDRV